MSRDDKKRVEGGSQKSDQKTVILACLYVACAFLLAIIQGDLSSDTLCPDPLLLAEPVYAGISTTNMAVRDQKAQKVTKWFFRPLMAYIHVYIHTYY